MKKPAFLLLILLGTTVLLVPGYACSNTEQALSLDEQAQEIYRSLMCPLCPGQTIDQSQSELSAQMRALVREKLEQGETREEILQFFVERYGESVLAAPVKSGFNLIVWVTPFSAILIGGIILGIIIRRKVRNIKLAVEQSSAMADTPDDKYRDQLEKDLESFTERGFR